MVTLADIATILRTTEKNVVNRIVGLRLNPSCQRCWGSGNYSFNGSHSRCYRCNGNGQEQLNHSKLDAVYAAAQTVAVNGKLDEYIRYLEATKLTKNALNKITNAWKACDFKYDWMKAVPNRPTTVQRDVDISAFNKICHGAYDRIDKLTHVLNSKSADYQQKVIELADEVTKAMATVESARLQYLEYLAANPE